MLCILTALKAESEPLIDFFRLEKDSSFNFPVFSNNATILVAIGVGGENISKRDTTVYNQFKRFNLSKGQCILFDGNLIHGGTNNRGKKTRVNLEFRLYNNKSINILR